MIVSIIYRTVVNFFFGGEIKCFAFNFVIAMCDLFAQCGDYTWPMLAANIICNLQFPGLGAPLIFQKRK